MVVLKTATELQLMQHACKISAQALKLAGEAVKPGVTTEDIDALIYDFILSQGARPSFLHYGGFPKSACISINDEIIHGIPSKKTVIKSGDIVSIDVGATIDGFHGDNAYTYAAGEISDEAKKLLEVTKESLNKAIEKAVAGARVGDLGYAVQSYVEENGFSVVREYVGHGVGRNLHEDPEIPNFGKPSRGMRLLPGMTIAIEPMVNAGNYAVKRLSDGWTVVTADHSLSAHFEHTIAITTAGPIIMTKP